MSDGTFICNQCGHALVIESFELHVTEGTVTDEGYVIINGYSTHVEDTNREVKCSFNGLHNTGFDADDLDWVAYA